MTTSAPTPTLVTTSWNTTAALLKNMTLSAFPLLLSRTNTGIQETLPVSIKHGGNTRPWTSIYRRSHSIDKSYMKLSEKLTERGRLSILAAVDKCLNDEVRDVAELFSDVFEKHNNPVIATSIHTGSKSYFLNAVDTGSNKKTASYADLFQKSRSQAEEEFKCHTVGIVTDNEKKMESMREKLQEYDNTLITYGCSSHLLNLLGQDVTPQVIINQINEVSKYFRNHHTPGALLSEFSNQGAVKPQTPGVTRWNSQLECIKIFNKNRPFYLMINAQHEGVIETRIAKIINNTALSNQANYLQEQIEPISIALNTL